MRLYGNCFGVWPEISLAELITNGMSNPFI